jgi:hypothetical protein
MKNIFSIDGFVDITHEPDIGAVRIKYSKLFDEAGVNIPRAVRAAASYATANGVKNWIADTALPTDDLSPKDAEWVATQEFRDILLESTIKNFVLIPPLPETGLDNSWIPDWQAATQAGFGEKIVVQVLETAVEIREFLAGRN